MLLFNINTAVDFVWLVGGGGEYVLLQVFFSVCAVGVQYLCSVGPLHIMYLWLFLWGLMCNRPALHTALHLCVQTAMFAAFLAWQ